MMAAFRTSVLIAILAAFMIPALAHAHSPYTDKLRYLDLPSGEKALAEKVYGDGILFADPVALQIRNHLGAVIAQSPAGKGIGVLCFSLNHCYAFPDAGIGISGAWRFTAHSASYDKLPASDDVKALKEYMENPAEKSIRGWDNNPEPGTTKSFGFEEAPLFMLFLSPFVLLVSYCIQLTCLFISFFLGRFIYLKAKYGCKLARKAVFKAFLYGCFFVSMGIYLISALIMLFLFLYTGTPILHMAIACILAIWLANANQRHVQERTIVNMD